MTEPSPATVVVLDRVTVAALAMAAAHPGQQGDGEQGEEDALHHGVCLRRRDRNGRTDFTQGTPKRSAISRADQFKSGRVFADGPEAMAIVTAGQNGERVRPPGAG